MQKILKMYRYALGAAVAIVCATLLRLILVLQGWPTTNGDEAIMNLMALHIVEKGEHPTLSPRQFMDLAMLSY